MSGKVDKLKKKTSVRGAEGEDIWSYVRPSVDCEGRQAPLFFSAPGPGLHGRGRVKPELP